MIDKVVAFRRLLVTWLVGGFVMFGLSIAQSIAGAYGDEPWRIMAAWGTFLPLMAPGVVVLAGLMRLRASEVTSRFMSGLCVWGSVMYLLLLFMTWAGWPLTRMAYREWMILSYTWLMPLQIAIDFVVIRMFRS